MERFYGIGHLTESQAEFVEYFVKDSTQTESARRAGYSSPATEAWRLLRLQHVQDAVDVGVSAGDRHKRGGATRLAHDGGAYGC